jgi:hypothetical protein
MLRARVACALGGDTPPLATTGCARGALRTLSVLKLLKYIYISKNTLNRKGGMFT